MIAASLAFLCACSFFKPQSRSAPILDTIGAGLGVFVTVGTATYNPCAPASTCSNDYRLSGGIFFGTVTAALAASAIYGFSNGERKVDDGDRALRALGAGLQAAGQSISNSAAGYPAGSVGCGCVNGLCYYCPSGFLCVGTISGNFLCQR